MLVVALEGRTTPHQSLAEIWGYIALKTFGGPVHGSALHWLAAKIGQSQAAVITLAIHRAVEHGLTIEAQQKS